MGYLLTQEMGPFQPFAAPLDMWPASIFLETKMDTSVRFQCGGPAAAESGNRNPAPDQFAAGFPEERSRVDFGTRSQTQPTNLFFFFPDMLAQKLTGELGRKKKERRGETAPGLEGDIVCMCTQAQGLWPAA